MVRTIDDIRTAARAHRLASSAIGAACTPPLSRVTVYRILSGRRRGRGDTQERISAAIDRLLAERAPAPIEEGAAA